MLTPTGRPKIARGEAPGPTWQSGNAAFSIGPAHFDPVRTAIDTQAEHHGTRSFQDEYREFLREHAIAFDERYVWD